MKGGSLFFRAGFRSPRLVYILDEILERRLGLHYQLIERDEPAAEGSTVLHYGIPGGDIGFPDSGILQESHTRQTMFKPGLDEYSLLTSRGQTENDLFGASVFLLSRYEEQTIRAEGDEHGRYPDSDHFDARFRQIPLVDFWVHQLRKKLTELGISCRKSEASADFSVDLDNATAFRQKGLLRQSAAWMQDLLKFRFGTASRRLRVHLGLNADPFDNLGSRIPYGLLANRRIFFWVGDYGSFDKGLSWKNSWYREKIRSLAKEMIPGLHPSWGSFRNPEQFRKEKIRLEEILEMEVKANRFHFLRFRLPESYRMLEENGITEDFSMGFSSFPGFRAGTSLPFQFYDLEKNQTGRLLIHPFSLMDSCRAFRTGSDEQFLSEAKRQLETGLEFGFPVHTIFHNEHPAWPGWSNTISEYLKLRKSASD